MSNQPVIAANKPAKVTLEKGQRYFWCMCGRSGNQPLCDGSHKGTGLTPRAFKADRNGDAWLCACKNTQNAPFCDGSHKQFAEDMVGKKGPDAVQSGQKDP